MPLGLKLPAQSPLQSTTIHQVQRKVRWVQRLAKNPRTPRDVAVAMVVVEEAVRSFALGAIDKQDLLDGTMDLAKDCCFGAVMCDDPALRPVMERLARAIGDIVLDVARMP